jgi:hypothetical protein
VVVMRRAVAVVSINVSPLFNPAGLAERRAIAG